MCSEKNRFSYLKWKLSFDFEEQVTTFLFYILRLALNRWGLMSYNIVVCLNTKLMFLFNTSSIITLTLSTPGRYRPERGTNDSGTDQRQQEDCGQDKSWADWDVCWLAED